MDYREKGGYQLVEMLFFPTPGSGEPHNVLAYLATEQNPDYLGPAPEQEIAKQIVACQGPSGPNIEYFLNLVKSLEQMCPSYVDQHLTAIKHHIDTLITVHWIYACIYI